MVSVGRAACAPDQITLRTATTYNSEFAMTNVELGFCNVRSFVLTYYGTSLLVFPFAKHTPRRVVSDFNDVRAYAQL